MSRRKHMRTTASTTERDARRLLRRNSLNAQLHDAGLQGYHKKSVTLGTSQDDFVTTQHAGLRGRRQKHVEVRLLGEAC